MRWTNSVKIPIADGYVVIVSHVSHSMYAIILA